MSSRITPCLWFDFCAEAAVEHYLAVFSDARITHVARYGDGRVLTIAFEIEGQSFLALNGGPQFPFTPAISLIVNCQDQNEIDRYWQALTDGGKPGRCGWLTDCFGVSWQIVPRAVAEWMTSGDAEASARVMKAVMSMDKLDMAVLQKAFAAELEEAK